MSSAVKTWVEPADLAKIGIGWGAVVALSLATGPLNTQLPLAVVFPLLATIIAVILVSAFGVLKQAEALAARLGDPYGSLVLTLSIVLIEVVLIAAVMLGPDGHETIGRDSVMAVSMIIMNLIVGLSLVVGGLRHGSMEHSRPAVTMYLGMLIVLGALAFGFPALIGHDGSYTPSQAIVIAVIVIGSYAYFLYRQMGPQAKDYQEPTPIAGAVASTIKQGSITDTLREHRTEIATRLVLLVVTVLPIVLLSENMADLLDDGFARLGAPTALAGAVIAMIVFLPESLTSIRAAANGEIQRVSNLCHGALVSTLALTIPAVLMIGLISGNPVVLAETPANLTIFALTMAVTAVNFSSPKVTVTHGMVHLMIFAVYVLAMFS